MDNNWIDIKKKKPEHRQEILVWDESMMNTRIMSAYYENEEDMDFLNWYNADGFYDDSDPEITHWMTLPEKPKKK